MTFKRHNRSCPAYGNYQPPYEECTCGAEGDPMTTPPPPQTELMRADVEAVREEYKPGDYWMLRFDARALLDAYLALEVENKILKDENKTLKQRFDEMTNYIATRHEREF